MDFLRVLEYSLISVLNSQFSLSVCISHLKKKGSVKGNILLNWINDPKDSSGVQSGPGRHPNHSFERFSIRFHIGPVRGPQGWSPGAECPQGSFQITSFTQVKGRITHSSHWSARTQPPGSATTGRRDMGQDWGGCQTWLTKPCRCKTCCSFYAHPLVSYFSYYGFFFTGSVQSC